MKFRKRQRLILVGMVLLLMGGATALVLTAFEEGIALFVTPSEIAQGKVEQGKLLRIGGLVEAGSVDHRNDGEVRFDMTDGVHQVTVSYVGILPDLFREEQGIVATGMLNAEGGFRADEVLAKHDETYVPKEVADAIKASGQWRGDE